MPLLSVIIPIYNVEDYLACCLDSMCAQTLSDIEVICVNDGSPDGSRAIAAQYADTDSRFKIIDKENGGISSARNAGIKAASAKYVWFVDSDDRGTPDACAKIIAAFNRSNADVVTFGANCYPESAGNDWLRKHLSPRDIEYDSFEPDLIFKEMSRPFPWRTACRRDFLIENQLFFDESVPFGEDQVFHFAVYPRSLRTLLMSDKLYDYRVGREGSMMHYYALDEAKKMREHVSVIDRIFDDWHSAGFLQQYPTEMMGWTVEFALYDIAKLNEPQRENLIIQLRELWLNYFTQQEIKEMELPRATKRMILAALANPKRFEGISGKILRYSYYKQQYGMRASLVRLLRGIGASDK